MLNYPNIDPNIFKIGPWEIHLMGKSFLLGPLAFRWYGMMYLLGFAAAYWVLNRYVRRNPKGGFTQEDISDAVFYGALGVILGGRFGYILFYNLPYYFEDPRRILFVWEGGMSFHGGFLGTLAAMILFSHHKKIPFYKIADIAIIAIPIGLFLGRIGNFINGELYGRATDVPWCMKFPAGGSSCRHPSQLYEALLEGVVLFLFLLYLNRKKFPPGVKFWSFIAGYGFFRFIVEFFREPDSHLGFILGPFSMGQLLSFPMALTGAGMIIFLFRKRAV